MDTLLKVTRENNKNIGTIVDSDRLNATIAAGVKEQLNKSLNESDSDFILDLQNIKFIDSTGIGVLISAL
jgi:anti-sigma B factor antagonist